jgi:hypothetical protein
MVVILAWRRGALEEEGASLAGSIYSWRKSDLSVSVER